MFIIKLSQHVSGIVMPFIRTFVLQVLLNQMAAVVLCSLRFRVLNLMMPETC